MCNDSRTGHGVGTGVAQALGIAPGLDDVQPFRGIHPVLGVGVGGTERRVGTSYCPLQSVRGTADVGPDPGELIERQSNAGQQNEQTQSEREQREQNQAQLARKLRILLELFWMPSEKTGESKQMPKDNLFFQQFSLLSRVGQSQKFSIDHLWVLYLDVPR